MNTILDTEFTPANLYDYVVVPGHDGRSHINRWTLARVVNVDADGVVQRAEHVGDDGEATGDEITGHRYVVEGMKPEHVRNLAQTEWRTVTQAHDALSDALLGTGWREARS